MGEQEAAQAAAGSGGPVSRRHHTRRQSTSERIDQILENARDRFAHGMRPDAGPTVHRRRPTSEASDDDDDDDDDNDEMTGIVSRGSGQNYQAMQTAVPSRRRSMYRRPLEDEGEDDDQEPSARGPVQTWWRKPLGKFQSIELENRGSTARDHLALERTFLAWLRTSLAFASIGIAVTQLFRLNTALPNDGHSNQGTLRHLGKPLGSTFLAISILTLLLGCRRYFRGQEWVMRGKFPASRGTIVVIAFVSLAIMLVSLVVVIVIHSDDDVGGRI